MEKQNALSRLIEYLHWCMTVSGSIYYTVDEDFVMSQIFIKAKTEVFWNGTKSSTNGFSEAILGLSNSNIPYSTYPFYPGP